jgi:hypothetical protein
MRLEIKKEKSRYILLNPPADAGTHFYVDVQPDKIIRKNKGLKKDAPNAHSILKNLVEKNPDNEFLKISLSLTPAEYAFEKELSDEQLLNEALSDKYEL